jgi:antirestriction protein ArdC
LHDFWDLTHKLGDSVRRYTNTLLHDTAIASAAAARMLHNFKNTMVQLISSTKELRAEVQTAAWAYRLTIEDMSEKLSADLSAVLQELKAKFPAPDNADNHEQRVKMVSCALAKVEGSVVHIIVQCGNKEI